MGGRVCLGERGVCAALGDPVGVVLGDVESGTTLGDCGTILGRGQGGGVCGDGGSSEVFAGLPNSSSLREL